MKGTVDTLKLARDNLLKNGWAQGTLGTAGHPGCAKGHVWRAETKTRFMASPVMALAAKELLDEAGIEVTNPEWPSLPMCPVVFYNDRVAKDVTDIVKLFDRAITKAEAIGMVDEIERYLGELRQATTEEQAKPVQNLSLATS